MFNLEIPEDRYNGMRRFWYIEFNLKNIEQEDLEYDMLNCLKQNHIRILSPEDAKEFIEIETNLEKISDWVFKIYDAYTDKMDLTEVLEKTLSI